MIVDPACRLVEKIAVPTGVEGALKRYDLREDGCLVGPAARNSAHALVESVSDPEDVGFVILHSCGRDVELLLVSRWRNENEIWSGRSPRSATPISSCWATTIRDAALEAHLSTTYAGRV